MTALATTTQRQEICLDCGGNGETGTPVFGRFAPEPATYVRCGTCNGTGGVPLEWVATCTDCQAKFWTGEGCDHHGALLCVDCKPARCTDCIDEQREGLR